MNPVIAQSTATSRPASQGRDPFDATTYSEWARRATAALQARPDAAVLYDNTIAEPAIELAEVVANAFSPRASSRFVSVFAGGNRFVVQAVAQRYGARPEQVMTTTGVTSGLALALKALVQPGDRVLVERPGFDLFGQLTREAGAEAVPLDRTGPDFRIEPEAAAQAFASGARALVISNLHNPSGAWLDARALEAIAAAAARTGAVVIVDEVYRDLAPVDGAPTAARIAPNIISASSLTKVFGLFALKCGWLIASPELIGRIRERSPDGDYGVSKLSHAVAAHVLEQPQAFEAHWRRVLASTRRTAHRHAAVMSAAGLIEGELPDYGCMFFPRVTGWDDTFELARRLWADYGLLVAPGEYYGAPGRIRIGFGADGPGLGEGLARLGAALTELKNNAS